ncbi:hypothetical protein [Clostridium rectalis]|uniref:hypothetical protein n=1 Tax=Clostridium rectalis TaxID=2040295 RepID=UPI000F63F6BF|nr:hypothetical protein [Clostridium rectalis]
MFNKFYAKIKGNKLEDLDRRIEQCKNQIKVLQFSKEEKTKKLQHLKLENEILTEKYLRIIELILDRGIIIDILNKGYKIKEWDNLYLIKRKETMVICSKNNEVIKIFNKEESKELEKIIKNKNYSIVVTRIEGKYIKIQFRVKDR